MTLCRSVLPLAFVAAALSLAGCKTAGEQLGSTLGLALGSQVGSGVGNAVATETGMVVGSVLGGQIAELLDEESQRRASKATGEAVATGQPQTWSNPEAGTSGEVTVTAQKQEQAAVPVVVLKDEVQELPPVDLIGRTYVATAEANVRGGPGTDYKTVESLIAGEQVNVVGKVRGKDWFMVSQGDVIIGYVSTTLLAEPATPLPKLVDQPKPTGAVVEQTVQVERTCRTAEHRVRLADGQVAVEQVEACATPTGWNSSTRPVATDGKGTNAKPT